MIIKTTCEFNAAVLPKRIYFGLIGKIVLKNKNVC